MNKSTNQRTEISHQNEAPEDKQREACAQANLQAVPKL